MENKKPCQKCGGKGHYETILKDIAGRQPHGKGIPATVPCELREDGIINKENYYKN